MRESKLDPKVILDRNNWALSVICHKGSNHAEIVIEKMTDDYQYIMQLTHFRGVPAFTVLAGNKGKVIPPKNISPADLKYDGKKTWSVLRVNVEKMISDIKREYDEEKYSESHPPDPAVDLRTEFNIFREHSIMPASAEEAFDPITPHSSSGPTIKSLNRGYSLAMLIAAAGVSIFTANPLPIISFFGVHGAMKLKNELEEKPNRSHTFDPSFLRIHSSSSLYSAPTARPSPRPKYETKKNQHNCFTWSREKLKIAGIMLPEGGFERFIILTRTYTNPGECPIKMNCS